MTEWYYADGQDRQGPLLVEDLRQRFQRGEISLTTLVWREGYPQWKPVSGGARRRRDEPEPLH